jgi:hypothetical protein
MTTSNSTDFNLARDEIVNEAYREIGVKTPGRALTSEEMNDGVRSLNIMIKSWEAAGIYLWKETEGTLFLVPSQNSYRLDAATANATTEFTQTTLSADEITGETTISVNDTSSFTLGDFVGIKQDNNTLHWSIINAIGATTIGINDALTNDASENNVVYNYTTKINRPQRISSCRLRNTQSQTDIVLKEISRSTYFDLSNKFSEGKPTKFYYDKQLNYGDLYLWSTAGSVDDLIKFTFSRTFEDYDEPLNTSDFPVEWLEAIITNLAYKLGKKYGIGAQRLAQIKEDAQTTKAIVEGWDREPTSIYFAPYIDINNDR